MIRESFVPCVRVPRGRVCAHARVPGGPLRVSFSPRGCQLVGGGGGGGEVEERVNGEDGGGIVRSKLLNW